MLFDFYKDNKNIKENVNNKIKLGINGSPRWVDYFAESFMEEEFFQIYKFEFLFQKYNKITKIIKIFKRIIKLNIIYIISGWLSYSQILMMVFSMILKYPIVIHWIGTDVYWLMNINSLPLNRKIRGMILKFLYKINKNCYHIACAPWLKEELNLLGIKSEFIPVISPMVKREVPIYPLPDKPTLLSYIPKGREDFYGEDKLLKLIRRNPNIHFIIIANSPERKPKDLNNCEYYDWISKEEMENLYKKVSCVVRLTKHDGLPGLGIEALLRGRYLIFIYEHPYVYKARTIDDAQKAIDEIINLKSPNYDGAQFVRNNYSMEIVKEKLKSFFMNVIKEWK